MRKTPRFRIHRRWNPSALNSSKCVLRRLRGASRRDPVGVKPRVRGQASRGHEREGRPPARPRCRGVEVCCAVARSVMAPSRRSRPPQAGHASVSIANVRRIRVAQGTRGEVARSSPPRSRFQCGTVIRLGPTSAPSAGGIDGAGPLAASAGKPGKPVEALGCDGTSSGLVVGAMGAVPFGPARGASGIDGGGPLAASGTLVVGATGATAAVPFGPAPACRAHPSLEARARRLRPVRCVGLGRRTLSACSVARARRGSAPAGTAAGGRGRRAAPGTRGDPSPGGSSRPSVLDAVGNAAVGQEQRRSRAKHGRAQ